MSVYKRHNALYTSGSSQLIEDPRSIIWREAYIVALTRGMINPTEVADEALTEYKKVHLG